MIKFRCPSCSAKIGVEDKHAGRSLKCPKCGVTATVPAASPEDSAGHDGFNLLADALNAEKAAAPMPVQFEPPPSTPPVATSAPVIFRPTVLLEETKPKPRYSKGVRAAVILGVFICLAYNVVPAIYNRQVAENLKTELADIKSSQSNGSDKAGNLDKIAGAFDRASDQMIGEDKAITKAMSQQVRWFESFQQSYQSALNALSAAGGIKPATLTTQLAIQQRLQLVDAMDKANRDFDAANTNAVGQLASFLDQAGVSPQNKQATVDAFSRKFNAQTLHMIRQTDSVINHEMKEMLNLLDANFGKWSIKPEGTILFKAGSGIAASYNDHVHKLNAAREEQKKLQAQIPTS